MRDFFQPTTEPAQSIYRAFQAESAKRDGRDFEEWHRAECEAVHQEAVKQAEKLGLKVLTIEEIADAECRAMGSADYGAKWAYGVVDAMHKPQE